METSIEDKVSKVDGCGSQCEGCGIRIYGEALTVPHTRLSGAHCSMECLETELVTGDHCRWCGRDMDTPYTTVDSRLCSEDCSENYYSRVRGYVKGENGRPGIRVAALGTGVRLSQWLISKAQRSNAPKARLVEYKATPARLAALEKARAARKAGISQEAA